jgi:hypothetical protein
MQDSAVWKYKFSREAASRPVGMALVVMLPSQPDASARTATTSWSIPRLRFALNPSVAKKQLCRECLQNLQHTVLEVLSGAEGQYELA